MINKSDGRNGWFGASDTYQIMSNFNSKTFFLWWLEKIGVRTNNFVNEAMLAGTAWEHRILVHIEKNQENPIVKDKQIKLRKLKLRVNYDGTRRNEIIEVKTHSFKTEYKVSKQHWAQVQVEMYVYGVKSAQIAAYGLVEDDYNNYFNEIDNSRLKFYVIEYDKKWIQAEYLPRLKYLAKCLRYRTVPNINDFIGRLI